MAFTPRAGAGSAFPVRFLPALTAAVVLTACGVRVKGFGTIGGEKIDAVPTQSPLGGQPLHVSRHGDPDIEVMRPEKCSFWPILDQYKVTADGNRVCVSAELFMMSYESGPLPIEKIELGLSSGTQPPTFFDATAAGMAKVGRCYGSDAMRTGVWSFQFVGCTPNQGLVTEYTQNLSLRRKKGLFAGSEGTELARWTFTDARRAPAPVVAAAPAPAPRPEPQAQGQFQPAPFPQQGQPPPPPPPPRPAPVAPQPSAQSRLLYQQGAQLLAGRNFADAMEKFSQCLDLEPQLAVGYVARGNALLGLRRYAEASADYAYALELDPNSAIPLYGLAEAARGMNDTRKARGYYQRVVDSRAADASPAIKQDASRKLTGLR